MLESMSFFVHCFWGHGGRNHKCNLDSLIGEAAMCGGGERRRGVRCRLRLLAISEGAGARE